MNERVKDKYLQLKKNSKKPLGSYIEIEGRRIGPGEPVFIIAEAGVNHNGNLDTAKRLVDVAAEAGADAVKFQTFTSELLVTNTAPQAEYQIKNTGKIESQLTMLKRLELPKSWHVILQARAKEKGIIFLSTPFSEKDADFLESIGIQAYKIPSGEITNIPYLKHIAQKGKPMIVSSGMSYLAEVKEAVNAIQEEGNQQIVVLHSTSNYPPSLESLNLKAINTLQYELNMPIGYSDNGSPGVEIDALTVGLGACVVEKHFTLDKTMTGPDHKASLEPKELSSMVEAIRAMEKILQNDPNSLPLVISAIPNSDIMLGEGIKAPGHEEQSIAMVARKSIVLVRDIKAGHKFKKDDFTTRRPGTGLPPKKIYELIGKHALRNLKSGSLLSSFDYED